MKDRQSQNKIIDELIANGTDFHEYFENEECSIDFLKACFHHANEALCEATLAHIEDAVQKADIASQDLAFLDELIPHFREIFSLAASYNALTEIGEYDIAWKCVRRVLDEFFCGPEDELLSDPEYLEALKVSADCYLEGRGTEQDVQRALDIYKTLCEKGYISQNELDDFEIKAESILDIEKIRRENDALFDANETPEGHFKRF